MGRKEKQLTTLVRKWERGLNWGGNASNHLCPATFHLWSGSATEGGSGARKESCVEVTKDVMQPGSLQPSNLASSRWGREDDCGAEGECGWKIKCHMQVTTSNIWHGGWVALHYSLQLLLTCSLLDELNLQPMYTCYRCLATRLMQEEQHKNMKESLERQ